MIITDTGGKTPISQAYWLLFGLTGSQNKTTNTKREREKKKMHVACYVCVLNWEGSMVVSSKALLLSSSKDSHISDQLQ